MTICCAYPGDREPAEEWASEWALETRKPLVFHRKAISMTVDLDGTARVEVIGDTFEGDCE